MGDTDQTPGRDFQDGLATRDEVVTPKLYRVLMHNDHYTTMEFVIDVLINVFRKTEADAYQIMMQIHNSGVGICGVFTLDIAKTKISEVHRRAREKGHPLRCSYEEA
jgi:ATP-dependent Clp protease adaptor protein ClpS